MAHFARATRPARPRRRHGARRPQCQGVAHLLDGSIRAGSARVVAAGIGRAWESRRRDAARVCVFAAAAERRVAAGSAGRLYLTTVISLLFYFYFLFSLLRVLICIVVRSIVVRRHRPAPVAPRRRRRLVCLLGRAGALHRAQHESAALARRRRCANAGPCRPSARLSVLSVCLSEPMASVLLVIFSDNNQSCSPTNTSIRVEYQRFQYTVFQQKKKWQSSHSHSP
jgi:hypothetical protein